MDVKYGISSESYKKEDLQEFMVFENLLKRCEMMRKNSSRIIKSIIILTIVASTLSTSAFAAWTWSTPGYEWAREKRLTSITNTSTLNNKVSHANFYSILIKYLKLKGVEPKDSVKQNVIGVESFNKALVGVVNDVEDYITRTSLTPQEYRELVTYIDHMRSVSEGVNVGTLPNNADLLTRDSLKDIYLYLSLAKYKAATLISDPSYKNLILSNEGPTPKYNVGNVAYKEIIDYNIKPYFGDISREEFLVLMFSLLSEQDVTEKQIIQQFIDAGVLMGYENGDVRLENPLTYAEMFTFLRRFEIFDFNPEPESQEGEGTEEDVKEYN